MNIHIHIDELEDSDSWRKTIFNGDFACLIFEDQPPRQFNLKTGLELPQLVSTPVVDAAYRPGHWQITFAFGDGSHSLKTFCLQTGLELRPSQMWNASFVAYSPDGQWMSAADTKRMILWKMDAAPRFRRTWTLGYKICGLDFDWEENCLLVATTSGVVLRSYLPGWNFPGTVDGWQ